MKKMNLDTATGEFRGRDKRSGARRLTADRREMIRFELTKNPRRSGSDRRSLSAIWSGRDKF